MASTIHAGTLRALLGVTRSRSVPTGHRGEELRAEAALFGGGSPLPPPPPQSVTASQLVGFVGLKQWLRF
jgi:hypothetical protein